MGGRIGRALVLAALLGCCALWFHEGAGYTYALNEDGGATIIKWLGGDMAVVPASIDGHPVTAIGEEAFRHCFTLKSVAIPETVKDIGDNTFVFCASLTRVAIPEGVTRIGESVFSGCYSLARVAIPESVTHIGESAFSNCYALTSISIPEGVTDIGKRAFYACRNVTRVTVPRSVVSIGAGAFDGCASLLWFDVSAQNDFYEQIDGVLFEKAANALHTYPAGRATEAYAVPDGVVMIGESAFSSCASLISVTIPDSVTNIGRFAFYECGNLARVTIPQATTDIGAGAFAECPDLVVECTEGSAAHAYALAEGIPVQ